MTAIRTPPTSPSARSPRHARARIISPVAAGRTASIVLIAALWLLLTSMMAWDTRMELKRTRTQTETLVDALAAHTSRVLQEADQVASVVTWLVQRDGVNVSLRDYLAAGLFKLDDFEQVEVVDRHGIVRSSTVPGFQPVDVSDREHFAVHVGNDSKRLYVSTTVTGELTGKPSIQLSRRIDDRDGRFVGVVVISMAPTSLTDLYDALRIGAHGIVSVLGTNDFIVRTRRSGVRNTVNLQLPEHDPLRVALATQSDGGLAHTSPVDGVLRSLSFRKLPRFPIAVVVGFSVSESLAMSRSRSAILVIAGALLSALILVADWYRIRLLRQAEAFAARERDSNRRKAQHAVRTESLFMAIPDAAVAFSIDGLVDGCNPHLRELLGLARADLSGATPEFVASAMFRDDRSTNRSAKITQFAGMLSDGGLEDAATAVFHVESGQPAAYELRVERRDGASAGTLALIRDVTVQAGINASERDLDNILHAIGDAVLSIDRHGRIRRMNAVAEQFSGWSASEATDRLYLDVLSLTGLATGADALRLVGEVLAAGRVLRHGDRYVLVSRRGHARKVAISAAPMRDAGHRITGAVLVLRDVTREHESEQALVHSETRYRLLVGLSPYAVFLAHGKAIISFANPKAIEMLGADSPDQLIGRSLLEFLHPDYLPDVHKRIGVVRNHRTAVPPMEHKWFRLDGSSFWGEAMAVPYDLDEESDAMVMLNDISARKEAELERDRIFALSLDLTCIAEPDGRFRRVNPAFSTVLGWSSDELLARPYSEFIHPDDRAETSRIIASHGGGYPIDHFENRYRCKDGSFRWLAWKAIELDGLVYATGRDVTQSRIATEQLERARIGAEAASRAKSAFLATMSHEIRTPMNGVIGMTEVLARTGLTPDQDDMLSTIRQSANALLSIIDDILDFSKIEAGHLHVEHAPVALVELIDGVCGALTPLADRAGVSLTASIAPAVPGVVLSDGTRLRQLMYNLVGNAIKFSGGRPGMQGHVAVRLDIARGARCELVLRIADNGIGMADATLAGLFEPFRQGEVSTTRRFGGTGLGLAICKRLVDLMGGAISVKSVEGGGSTFTVRLPVGVPVASGTPQTPRLPGAFAPVDPTNPRDPGHPATPTTIAEARAARKLILVAEDDEVNQKVILRQLALLGHAAEIASDGVKALAQWRSGQYALLLTDLHMPGMDGYELVGAIRREEPAGVRMPVIALTANASKDEAEKASAAGMDVYLTKPLQLARLRAVLGQHLSRHRAAAPDTPEDQERANPPVDLAVMKKIVGDDDEGMRALLGDYLTSLRTLAAELRGHAAGGRGRETGAVAHKLKSSSRSVGALQLGDLCAELENAGKTGSRERLRTLLVQFDRDVVTVENAIAGLLRQSRPDERETP